jgi:DNA ligase D-like protein (predicted 3'-phosphoesterase)
MSGSIKEYRKRRDFSKTPEPRGSGNPQQRGRVPQFVIQEHDTDLHHFDFRLEIDDVLKSWVVPDGLPAAVGESRLALQMEDYPLEYAEFEGVIPSGQYGEGTVTIHARGTFKNLTKPDKEMVSPEKAIDEGYLLFQLDSGEFSGVYALRRTEGGPEPRWQFVKK